MKRIILLLALLVPVLVLAAPEKKSEEKVEPASHHELIELFSVYCGACYMWDQQYIPELKEKLKARNISLQQAHTPFMGKYSTQISTALAITADSERFNSLKQVLFKRIHVDRKGDWPSDKDFFASLDEAGLSEKDYNQNKNNMMVLKKISDWKKWAESVNAIPSFLLDGEHPISSKGMQNMDEFVERIEKAIKDHHK